MARPNERLADVGKNIYNQFALLENLAYSTESTKISVMNEHYRFRMFGHSLGLCHRGHSSLDYRLRDADDLCEYTLGVLHYLVQNLSKFPDAIEGETNIRASNASETPPWADEDGSSSEDSEDLSSYLTEPFSEVLLNIISSTIDRLFRIARRIRDPAMRIEPSRAIEYTEKDPETGIDIIEQFRILDLARISDLLRSYRPPASENWTNHYLVKRLAKANTHRRQRFGYNRHRRDQYIAESNRELGEGHATASQPSTATCLNVKDVDFRESASTIYTSSSMISTGTGMDHQVIIPEPPTINPGAKEFECPYCFTLLSSKTHQRKNWEMHIYRDLSPYVCTFEHCQNADQQYDSLHDWIEHEVASHSNADERTTYIRAYNDTLSKAPAKATGRICPFCCIGSASPTHIAWHLRRVASFALPRLAESESRDESDSRNSAAADFDSDDTYSDGSIELLEEDTPLRRYSSKTSQDSEEERYREDYSSSSEGSNQPDLHKHRDMANEQSKKTSGSPDSNQAVHGASQTSGRSHRANSGLSSPRSNSPQPSIIQRRFSNSDAEEDNMTLKLNGLSIGFTSEAVEGESIGIGPGGGVRLNITSGKRPRPNSREPRVSRENSPFSRDNEQVIGHDMPEGSDIQLGMGRLQKEIDPAREQFERGRKEFVEDRPDSRISWGNREEAELDEEKIAAGLHKLQHFERKDQSEEEQRNAEERYQRKKLADKRAAAEEEEKRAGHNPREERLEDTTRKHDEESQRAKFMREEKWKELARIQEEEEEREKLIQEIRDEDMRKAREAEEKRRKEMAMRAAAVEEWKQEQERMKQRMTEEAMRKATEFRVRLRSIGYTEEEIDAIINKETEERTREEKKQAKHTQETLDEAMQKAWEIGKKEQTATEAASAENGQTSPERNTLGLPHGGDSIQNVWWCCCQCNSLANPKLAEKQCPICAHHHCSACKSELVPP